MLIRTKINCLGSKTKNKLAVPSFSLTTPLINHSKHEDNIIDKIHKQGDFRIKFKIERKMEL